MGFKIKNSLTGEFEKLPILTLKGEKGETGGVEEYNKVDYMGNKYETLKQANDANVEYAVKTAIGEFNYLDYDGQHITATDSIEGRSKSAILKGQTLVNLAPKKIIDYTASSDWDGFHALVQNSKKPNEQWRTLQDLKPNTKYYISCYVETFEDVDTKHYHFNNSNHNCLFVDFMKVNGVGRYQWISTTRSEFTDETFMALRCQNSYARGAIKIRDIMIIEYQEGMENWDIPYFEGMKSVKMPVLTTTGKNLFNLPLVQGSQNFGEIGGKPSLTYYSFRVTNEHNSYIEVEPNAKITFSIENGIGFAIAELDESGNRLGDTGWINGVRHKTITTKPNTRYIGFNFRKAGDADITPEDVLNSNPMLEYSATPTTYVPYQANVLSCNEEVTLRGIGDVQDTLDCLTGEVVERIGEDIYNGSKNEYWFYSGTTDSSIEFARSITNVERLIACDKLPISGTAERFVYASNKFYVRVLKSKLSTLDVDGFNKWLSTNPITVQYQLATPIVKTVDLSDNVVYSYKDTTHYDCSSAEGSLVPTLSVKVPTDTQLTIQEQKATTQTLLIKNMDLQQSIKEVQAMNLAFNTALYNSFNSIREEVEDIKKYVSTNENLEGSF